MLSLDLVDLDCVEWFVLWCSRLFLGCGRLNLADESGVYIYIYTTCTHDTCLLPLGEVVCFTLLLVLHQEVDGALGSTSDLTASCKEVMCAEGSPGLYHGGPVRLHTSSPPVAGLMHQSLGTGIY